MASATSPAVMGVGLPLPPAAGSSVLPRSCPFEAATAASPAPPAATRVLARELAAAALARRGSDPTIEGRMVSATSRACPSPRTATMTTPTPLPCGDDSFAAHALLPMLVAPTLPALSDDEEDALAPQTPPVAPTSSPLFAAPQLFSWAALGDGDDEDDEEELAPLTPSAATKTCAAGVVDEDEGSEVMAQRTLLATSNVLSVELADIWPSSRAMSPPRGERPWLVVPRQRRPWHGRHPVRGNDAMAWPAPCGRSGQEQASLLRFINKTKGKCSRCLAPSHRASKCKDQMRCFSCDESGHRERFCPHRRKLKPPSSLVCASTLGRAASSPTAPGARSWAEIVAVPLACEVRKGHGADVAGGGQHGRQDRASEGRDRLHGPRSACITSPVLSSSAGFGRHRAASPPPTLSVDDTVVTIVGLHHAFAEQASHLRDDLNAAIDKALQPLMEEVAALRSWLGRTSSFVEQAEKLATRLDIASPVFATLPCSPAEGPFPLVVDRPPSAAVGPTATQSPVPLHGEDVSWNEGTPITKDASPTFTSVTLSSSPPSPVRSRCLLDLSCGSPFLVRDISLEFEPSPLGMPVSVSLPLPLLLSTPAPKKTKCVLLASPRRSGRIAQQKKKLPNFKSKGAPKKNKKSYAVVKTILDA
ncbi:hypothetical protein ACQ4PT_068859 [Festuca glaucescens]